MRKVNWLWLQRWKTPAGGFTKKQLAALTVPWPPPKHWPQKVIGLLITHEQMERFEREGNANPVKPIHLRIHDPEFKDEKVPAFTTVDWFHANAETDAS
jgi:hypothetical protein